MSIPPIARQTRWFEPLSGLSVSPAVLLLVFALLIAAARSVTFFEPMDRDLADYATVAHELRWGRSLYSDIPEQKPPAIHLTYYAAESIAGYGPAAIYLLTVAGSVLMLLATYAACVEGFGSRAAALWVAALWALISGHMKLQGNQPNTELFINAFTMLGIFCLLRVARMQSGEWRVCVLAGLCFGWAALYKWNVVVMPGLFGLAGILVPPPGKSRGRALGEMALVGAVILAMVALTVGYFWARGHLQAFLDFMVRYNSAYAGSLTGNLRRSITPGVLFPNWMWITLPLVIAGFAGLVLGAIRKQWAPVAYLLALLVGTQIAVALPGRFFPHYYQMWFPWLMLATGFALAGLEAVVTNPRAVTCAGILIFGTVAAREMPNYLLSANQWSQSKYGPTFVYSNSIARLIDSTLKPNETFFQMGEETELYPVSGRRPPSRFLGVLGVCRGPFIDRFRKELIEDLSQSKPDLIVVSAVMPYPELNVFMRTNYASFPTGKGALPALLKLPNPEKPYGVETYAFFVRRGSDLERRFTPPAASSGAHP